MALEQITFNIAAFNDADAGGNNYYAGIIYEVFNLNDTLADIYSDSTGANPINQDGISNVSSSKGMVKFYIDKGAYYAVTEGERLDIDTNVNYKTLRQENAKYNPPTIQDAIDYDGWDVDGGEIFKVQGYHSIGVGSGEWKTIVAGLTPNVDLPDGTWIVQFAGVPTLAAKLQIKNNIYDVSQFGAINGADDNTVPMQATATQAGVNGGVYFLPIGLWIHGQIDIDSSTIMMGCGYESRDQRLSDVGNAVTTRVGYRFFGEQGVAPYPPEENVRAITCHQIHFSGTVVDDGFQEFKHLIMMQGATDIDIQTCWFTGWQGDAIVVRSGNFTAAAQNLNVKIKDCVFDGINNNQRNAISITDVYGMTIRDNKFKNCTRNGEFGYTAPDAYDIFDSNKGPAMPGAIDIEPNTVDTYVVLNDIYIGHNNCENIQGNVAAIGMTMPIATEDFTNDPVRNITIENNVLDGVNTGFRLSQVQNATVTNVLRPLNASIYNNAVTDALDRPFWLFGVRGVKVNSNSFERCANAGAVGFIGTGRNCDQIDVNDNSFRHCGTTDGSALIAYSSSNLDYIGNVFDNCGITGGGFGVLFSFSTGASSEIRVERNMLVNNEGLTTGLFSLAGGGSIISGSGNNTYKSNNFLQFDSSAFPADFTDFGESSFESGITATAGGQAGAFLLSKAMNIITGGASFDSVRLPTATGNARVITVNNRTAVSIQVFPFAGDNLGQGLNSPESLAAENSRSYRTYDLNNWIKTNF